MHQFKTHQLLPISISEAWSFFSSPENLSKITPPEMDFKILTPNLPNKIYNGIKEKTTEASLVTLMSASNLFGRTLGEKKIELIMNEYPDILISKESNAQKIQKIFDDYDDKKRLMNDEQQTRSFR